MVYKTYFDFCSNSKSQSLGEVHLLQFWYVVFLVGFLGRLAVLASTLVLSNTLRWSWPDSVFGSFTSGTLLISLLGLQFGSHSDWLLFGVKLFSWSDAWFFVKVFFYDVDFSFGGCQLPADISSLEFEFATWLDLCPQDDIDMKKVVNLTGFSLMGCGLLGLLNQLDLNHWKKKCRLLCSFVCLWPYKVIAVGFWISYGILFIHRVSACCRENFGMLKQHSCDVVNNLRSSRWNCLWCILSFSCVSSSSLGKFVVLLWFIRISTLFWLGILSSYVPFRDGENRFL